MKTPYLFDVPRTAPSRRDRLKEFKAKHEIETFYSHGVDDPWLACHMPTARKNGYGIPFDSTMPVYQAAACELLDQDGVNAYGETEREAIRAVCENLGIPCDL